MYRKWCVDVPCDWITRFIRNKTIARPNQGVQQFCGIAGYIGNGNEPLLKAMIETLKHRGPDDTGIFIDNGIGLASARLSIIDIQGGHQPIHNEENTIKVTYNGEIYNFHELRHTLESKGHKFYTQSDTEVIVHSYEEYGESFVTRLNGMFAIALWDSKSRKLILARDRMGIKPLYYAQNDEGSLFFASEIKSLLQAPLKRAVDQEALYTILNLGYVPGNKTLLEGICKLPASTILVHENNSTRTRSYWDMPPIFSGVDKQSLVEQLDRSLEESIRDQLVADVPVGCFLSGGLDTGAIVAYASKASTQPLKTFCMGFGEETDEFRDARLIAEHFGTDHRELMVDSSHAMKLYPRMIWHMEAPKYNLYPWFVCELVHRHVKVCLSGNGGDEIFGGYQTRYEYALRIARLASNRIAPLLKCGGSLLQSVPENVRKQNRFRALKYLGDNVSEYLVLAGVLPDSFNRKLFTLTKGSQDYLNGSYAQYFEGTSFLDGLMRAELRTKLVDDLLAVDDTMSMAHSLELRVPLLDHRIVDLITPLPWQMKYTQGAPGKILLRKAVREILPEQSLRKPKWGFSVNVLSWYKGELGELIQQILPESDAIGKYFSRQMVHKLLQKEPVAENRRYQVLLWQLLGFHFWHKIFIEKQQSATPNLEINALVS
jgi:asparagine synthase (glutamine-hydrolysing)